MKMASSKHGFTLLPVPRGLKIISLPSGFTIVELLVVIVVIGILAAITIVSYSGITSKANIASLSSDLTNASTQLKMFSVDNSNYPSTISTDCVANPDTTTNKCLKPSINTTYTYKASPTNHSIFCLEASKSSNTYNITQEGQLLAGPCPVLNLDASNSLSYSGTGTTWKDLSGNDNNGMLNGGVSYSTANGGVMGFDGVNGYVLLPNEIVPTSNIRSSGISYSAWVKSINTTTEQRIIGQKPSIGYSDLASGGLGISTGKAKMIAYDDSSSYKYAIGNTSLQNNIWYFIVGIYDASDRNMRIFINGVFDGGIASIITFDRLISNSENIIGSLNINSSYSFNGSMSNLCIYNKTLSANEINQNFNALKGRYGL